MKQDLCLKSVTGLLHQGHTFRHSPLSSHRTVTSATDNEFTTGHQVTLGDTCIPPDLPYMGTPGYSMPLQEKASG